MAWCPTCGEAHLSTQFHRCGVGVSWAPDYGATKLPADWAPSMDSRFQELRAAVRYDYDVRDGMRALARFMVWVEVEAWAMRIPLAMHQKERRAEWLSWAIGTGRLRLAWPEGEG